MVKSNAVKSETEVEYKVEMTEMTEHDEDRVISKALEILSKRFIGREKICDVYSVKRYLLLRYHKVEHEIFGLLFLTNQHEVIAMEELFHGTIDSASVYPREVVKAVLAKNAARVILYHNHPSGFAEPSMADKSLTKRIKNALSLIDVEVLDHIIVGKDIYSFAEHGEI